MQTTLNEWAQARADLLAEDGARPAMIRGYLDGASGMPENVDVFIGQPFAADDYFEGYGLAVYELGPVTAEEIAA